MSKTLLTHRIGRETHVTCNIAHIPQNTDPFMLVVWGKKLSGVEWSGVESWSGVCIVELNCNNTQYMYIQEINVYLILRYTKNTIFFLN